jgi:pimeloyl-ACP methyl ester carboxylesterase
MHGDGFKPHPNLEPYLRTLEGLTYFSAGDARASTVLLIHGNGDEADSWRHVFTPLSAQHRVIALDLPGFGRSVPTGDGGIANLASSVRHFLELLNVNAAHLVGSSLGAVVAARVAANAPQLTRSLTIIGGSSPSFGGLKVNPALQPLLEVGTGEAYYTDLRQLGRDAAFDSLRPYYVALDALPANDLEFLRQRVWARVWSDSQRTAFFAGLRSLFTDTAALELPVIPTQLIWGAMDAIVPISHAHKLQRQLPHATLEIIAGSGHLPQQEQPLELTRVLENFLQRH